MAEGAQRLFTVRAVSAGGAQTLQVWAHGAEDARRQVELQGNAVLAVGAARPARHSAARQRREVAWWCRELRSLVRSGMTVVEAMDTMAAAATPGSARARTQTMLVASLREGHSLSHAMARQQAFPPVLVASVAAAEQTSKLGEALDEYLRYDEMLDRLARQVVSAAIYPLVVAGLGAVITLFLLVFVIPRFSRMYAELPPSALGGATRWVVQISQFLTGHSAVAAGGALVVVIGVAWFWRSGRARPLLRAAVDGVPWLRREIAHFGQTQLYHALGLMVRGGFPLHDALDVCARMTFAEDFSRQLAQVRREVGEGQPLAGVFARAGLADTVSARLLAVAERTGEFDVVLQTIAERHGQSFATFVERATRIVEPVLLLVVALVVGGIVLMMYLPIFDVAGQMGMGP